MEYWDPTQMHILSLQNIISYVPEKLSIHSHPDQTFVYYEFSINEKLSIPLVFGMDF